jgi:hypothetical protein
LFVYADCQEKFGVRRKLPLVNIRRILAELKSERSRLNRAIVERERNLAARLCNAEGMRSRLHPERSAVNY